MAWQAGTSEPLGTVGQGGGLGMAPWGGGGPPGPPVPWWWVLHTPTALHKGLLIFPGGCSSARAAGGSVGAAVPPQLTGTHLGLWHPDIPPCVCPEPPEPSASAPAP